jgi:hypothetical protein
MATVDVAGAQPLSGSTRPAQAAAGAPFGSAPPPSVPLTFFACAALALAGFGLVVVLGANRIAGAPRDPSALAATHLGLLAFASVAVVGALHQFAPVVGARPLRSTRVACATGPVLFAGATLLATGFGHGIEALVPIGGALAFTAVCATAWNVSQPLSARGKGVPLAGLRISVTYLVATASFGVVYAFDRTHGWFPLLSQRVVAHAHLGLIGWLGITYVAVSEKLWPMFLLSHRKGARSGAVAIALLGVGVPVVVTGLLLSAKAVVVIGGVVVASGLAAHLVTLAGVIRQRHRNLELLHAFVLASALSLVAAIGFAAIAGLVTMSTPTRADLVAAEVGALFGWIALAIIGHAQKIVPFVTWRMLRERGVERHPNGTPLLFAHLYNARGAQLSFAVAVLGVVTLVVGLAAAVAPLLSIAGIAFAVTAAIVAVNLTVTPRRVAARGRKEVA